MSNLRIAYLNRADLMTLTASPVADTSFPVTYLQNDSRGYLWKATAVAAQDIKGTVATAYSVGYCRLDRHNLSTNDTWRLQLYSDVAWASSVYDSGTIDAFVDNTFDNWDYGFSEMYFTPVSVKSFKLTITPATVIPQASRIFLGPYTEAQYQAGEGSLIGWQGNSTQSRRDGGSLAVDVRAKWRQANIEMMVDTEANRAIWMEVARYCTNEKTVCVSLYPGAGGTSERDMSIMGKFQENPMQKLAQNRFDFSLQLNEL